ncbi:hypothetical protein ACLI4Z_01730 [Natrialbaceae archaeon A-arb3/5]
MRPEARAAFVRTTLVLCAVALPIAAIVSPPDPFTLLAYAIPLLLLAPVLSYVLTVGGGFDALKSNT